MTSHFTAWLVNDPSALDAGCMDVTILEDRICAYRTNDDGREIPDWTTDTSKPVCFYGITTVDAKDGDIADALDEAEELMAAAGWRTAGDWDAADNVYAVTVCPYGEDPLNTNAAAKTQGADGVES